MYQIHFQNIQTFTYQKALLYTLLLLVFKIVKSVQCIRKDTIKAYFCVVLDYVVLD